jgi:hypothetical protein
MCHLLQCSDTKEIDIKYIQIHKDEVQRNPEVGVQKYPIKTSITLCSQYIKFTKTYQDFI